MVSQVREKVKEQKGFTLIELLVVIAIIAILAAIAIPQYAKYRERAAKASVISDAKNIANSIEAYYADKLSYPANLGELSDLKSSPNNVVYGYGVLGKTVFTFTVSNSIYNKSVIYDSSKGGLDETVWQ